MPMNFDLPNPAFLMLPSVSVTLVIVWYLLFLRIWKGRKPPALTSYALTATVFQYCEAIWDIILPFSQGNTPTIKQEGTSFMVTYLR